LTGGSRKRKSNNNLKSKDAAYLSRCYERKEVNLEERLSWNRYLAHEKEFCMQYKDTSSEVVQKYLDRL